MKKTLGLLVLLFCLCVTLVLYAKQIPRKGYVSPDIGLNVRTGPSEDSTKLGALTKGTTLNIIAVSGDWYKINSPMSGYVHGGFVTVTEYGEAPDDDGGTPEVDYSTYTPEERKKVGRNYSKSAANAQLK